MEVSRIYYATNNANEQGVAGKHISFNLAADINTKEFFDKLCDATASMPCVSLNKGDVHQLGPDGPLGGWNCFFMSGPNGGGSSDDSEYVSKRDNEESD